MIGYPNNVLSEEETLRRVVAGASIARYGDGEFKLCRGNSAVAQEYQPDISQRLREILLSSGKCMVGIPNIYQVKARNPNDQKINFWMGFENASSLLTEREYGSAFITRPDSAPWINTAEYWAALESLWLGKDVTLVRGSTKGLTSEDLMGAGTITEVIGPRQHAWREYDQLLARIGTPKRAILCLGPCATVMAADLCSRGVHAIDLGHTAIFLRKVRRGEPLTLTKDDKSHDKPQPEAVTE